MKNISLFIISFSLLIFSCNSKKIQKTGSSNITSSYKNNAAKIARLDTASIPSFTTVRIQGWRIQLKPTNDRNKMMQDRTILVTHFGEHKNYILYHTPFYKVRLGNFKNSSEAIKVKTKLSRYFPNEALFIIQDTIEYRMPKAEFIQWQIRRMR